MARGKMCDASTRFNSGGWAERVLIVIAGSRLSHQLFTRLKHTRCCFFRKVTQKVVILWSGESQIELSSSAHRS